MKSDREEETGEQNGIMWSWAVIWGLALLFLLYGLTMFFIVGDKGPPDWDFNVVQDIPGKSQYSTHPEPGGSPKEPDPQHVAGRPLKAPAIQGEGELLK